MEAIAPSLEPARTQLAIVDWWTGLGPGERMWRLDTRHTHGPPSMSRVAFHAGDIALSQERYCDLYGLGQRRPPLFRPGIEFIQRDRWAAVQDCTIDRLMVRKEGRDRPGGEFDLLTQAQYPAIFIPFGGENQYALDWDACTQVCDEFPNHDMNLVFDSSRERWRLMESIYEGRRLAWRLFFDSDNPDDRPEIQKAVRVQAALDQLIGEYNRIKGVMPPRPWPHDEHSLPIKL